MADTSPTVLTLRDRAELEVLFDTMPAAIAITRGPDHRFELTNKRYLEIAERSDLVGRTPVELRPDLAILDVQMPGTDGLTLAQRLRDFEHLPFVMLSAYSDAPSVEKATQSGALAYMVKPIDVAQMVPTIAAALLRAQDLRALHTLTEQLRSALDVEREISVAVGITMVQYRLGRQAAFDMLRAAARTQRRKLAEVAKGVVQAHAGLHGG